MTENHGLGEFATWRAARAVGDQELNTFLIRADAVSEVDGIEPGMTVWLDGEGKNGSWNFVSAEGWA